MASKWFFFILTAISSADAALLTEHRQDIADAIARGGDGLVERCGAEGAGDLGRTGRGMNKGKETGAKPAFPCLFDCQVIEYR